MPSEVIVQSTLFEALVRSTRVDALMKSRLNEAGYDVDRPRASYPASVFLACQEVVLNAAYSGRPRGEAYRQMGRDIVRSYFDTLVGKVVGVALSVAGPERAMRRVALSFRSVFEPINIRSEPLGPQDWRVEFRSYPFPAESAAGTCEEALRKAGAAQPRVTLEREDSAGFDLRIRW
ncbi:TIGR02265 family protein [Corallococcus sp. H22C18031201]|uniref:DUF2378 family protein n=1 Tax=Citreicoccus inhibens TaxID=2849499 RepID=UPI000E709363|nr:DUF2378 family protein [Citreicoccus inhibens]MBU8894512.1 DUF2378 family protein [Citreicoccus inhibens]RJS25111.1 TIGR02265 family protein [Corallococcus sp. H22C18031201]